MKKMIFILLAAVFVSGCVETTFEPTATSVGVPPLSEADANALKLYLLSASELEGSSWLTDGAVEQKRFSIEPEIIFLGWKGGYEIIFKKGNPSGSDFLEVGHSISLYPPERIADRFSIKPKALSSCTKLEELAGQKIGDASRAYKITDTAAGSTAYLIEFTKGNVYSSVLIAGTSQFDINMAKSLAQKAAAKIK